MTPSACARIRLSAIQHNFKLLHSLVPSSRVMAVVKGNAYGHGMLPVANALPDADSFAVARISEAQQLRNAGVSQPVVLLGGIVSKSDLQAAAALEVSLCVQNEPQIDWLNQHSGGQFSVWLKIDTGMNRLGFGVGDTAKMIARLSACAAVSKLGVMTHFANADDPADKTTLSQLERFRDAIGAFDGDLSIANSAGLVGFSEHLNDFASAYDGQQVWIRPGISLYGISPLSGHTALDFGLRPAMQFESRLISVRHVCRGAAVGYGGVWQAPRDTVIGTIAVGYGDGYPASVAGGTPVLINAREVPIVGRISMDLMAVDLGPTAIDKIGDSVVLWGQDLPVEQVAEKAGTGAYQLVTGVTHREAPVYVS